MIHKVDENEFEKEVLQAEELVVVNFNADWCGSCHMLEPILEELSKENKNVKFVSINVDNNGSLAQKQGIQSIPCVVFFKNGQEVNRNIGFMSKSTFEEILKESI